MSLLASVKLGFVNGIELNMVIISPPRLSHNV